MTGPIAFVCAMPMERAPLTRRLRLAKPCFNQPDHGIDGGPGPLATPDQPEIVALLHAKAHQGDRALGIGGFVAMHHREFDGLLLDQRSNARGGARVESVRRANADDALVGLAL